ncbi:MAG: ABC transporter permease, partial [Bacteroidetes bacterium]|nr:ABC transporter permease [Bacteroidota bacterium]
LFMVFATLAIIIACMGLFGLSSFMTIQKSKEIGVRKVLRASITSIIAMLTKDFSKLVILSAVIAIPARIFLWKSLRDLPTKLLLALKSYWFLAFWLY